MVLKYLDTDIVSEISQISETHYFNFRNLNAISVDDTILKNIYVYDRMNLNDETILKLINIHRYNMKLHALGYDRLIVCVNKESYGDNIEIVCLLSSKNRLPSIINIPDGITKIILKTINNYQDIKEIRLPDKVKLIVKSLLYNKILFSNIEHIKSITTYSDENIRNIKVKNNLEMTHLDQKNAINIGTFAGLKRLVINESCNINSINCNYVKRLDVVLNKKIDNIILEDIVLLDKISIYTPLDNILLNDSCINDYIEGLKNYNSNITLNLSKEVIEINNKEEIVNLIKIVKVNKKSLRRESCR